MGETADVGTVQRLVNAVDDFKAHYAKLADIHYGAAIARTGDNQLLHDYGRELLAAEATKRKIETVTGAWDNLKQWAGLGAIPLIPIAIAIGLIAAVTAAVASISKFTKRADIVLALKRDPDLTYEQAAQQVERTHQSTFGQVIDVARLGMWLAGGFLFYKLLENMRR